MLDLEGDGNDCRYGRGAAREGSRAAHQERERGAEQCTGEIGEELRSRGETSGGGMSGGERERSNTGGDWDKPRQEERGTWATWWAGPAHFLLFLSFSFFLFFFLHHLLL